MSEPESEYIALLFPLGTSHITTQVGILPAGELAEKKTITAMWDTGASDSIVRSELVEALGISPKSAKVTSFGGGVGGERKDLRPYSIDLLLSEQMLLSEVQIYSSEIAFDMIIGLDIISKGCFYIENNGSELKFIFSLPSSKVHSIG